MYDLYNSPFSRGIIQIIMMGIIAKTTREYIDQLTAQGEISFTKQRMQREMEMTERTAEKAIHALRKQGEIASAKLHLLHLG